MTAVEVVVIAAEGTDLVAEDIGQVADHMNTYLSTLQGKGISQGLEEALRSLRI